jgi:effector-binding domain-containing protein
MGEPNFKSWYPVFGIRSFKKAIDYYVDWLGFNVDWEWRAAPGEPAIVSISRDGITIGLNEHPDASTGAWLCVAVNDCQALADEWNGRRPGSATVVKGVPYEGSVISLIDPWGNRIEIQQMLTDEQNAAVREERVPQMREFVSKRLADGGSMPTPEEIVEAKGPSLGLAIEVLNEFPEYAEVFNARREQAQRALQIEVVEVAAQPTLVIEREAALEELGANVGDALTKVGAHLAARGAVPSGRPFMRFDDLKQKFTVTIGFPVDSDVEADGEVERRKLPGGKVLKALYIGPPGGLPAAWDTVIAYADVQGHRRASSWGGIGGWQVYLNDPKVVGAANSQTRLYLPIGD